MNVYTCHENIDLSSKTYLRKRKSYIDNSITNNVLSIYNRSHLNVSKIVLFIKRYPIPVFAVLGLLLGAISNYVLNQSVAGQWIWLLTLIIGGIPVVWATVKGMLLHHHFASDIVAMLAIVAAIITNEALPGVVIVIMQTGGKALEDYAFRRASSSLDELMARSPRVAYRKMREGNKK